MGKAGAFSRISLQPLLTSNYKILFQEGTISAEETVPDYSFKCMLPSLKNFLLSKLSAG